MPHFEEARDIVRHQIQERLKTIFGSVFDQRQAIPHLEVSVTGKGKGPERMPKSGWKPFAVHTRWGGFDQTHWFRMKAKIPKAMKGERVVALLKPAAQSFVHGAPDMNEGGEALAYVNGAPAQGIDRNHEEMVLTEKAKGGETFEIVLEATPSTRHDFYHVFAHADIAVMRMLPWEFYWDATVALDVTIALEPNFAPRRQLFDLVDESVKMVDLSAVGLEEYFDSLASAQRYLRKGLKEFRTSYGMGAITLAGHSHIDTAWLWPLRETRRKCARTFSTMLSLMDRYPEFHFSCSQPVQYEWIKTHYPEIYKRIKQRVKEGRWELCGAPWCEPDHNVPSGESLIRQYLYGNRWFQKEFGMRSHVAWVPDSFGYTWQLPQIMKKCQIEAFITTKIDWGQFTKFPYSFFMWEGADGTRIPALMPPLNYNGWLQPDMLIDQWNQFKQKEVVDELPFSFGWGDGGGGPTMKMIENGRRLENMVGVPKSTFGRIEDTVDRMVEKTDLDALPVYNDELYLELHRACQISQARTKRNNRKCEFGFHNAEFLGGLSVLHGGSYDGKSLWEGWKMVLTNQFHDILPGSSINEVYTQCDIDYAAAKEHIATAHAKHAKQLIGKIDTRGEGTPVVVFNPHSWLRYDTVRVNCKLPKGTFSVVSPSGEVLPHQRVGRSAITFQADGIPPLGWSVYRLVPGRKKAADAGELTASPKGMENECLRIRFDKNGNLSKVYDKVAKRDVLAPGQKGNVLQLFDDRPFMHDAWDIDFNYEENMWETEAPESIEVVEEGPVRAVVRIVRKTEKSTITQDVTLYAGSPRVDFVTHVDWWDRHTLLKAAFPVDVRSSRATYEIQFGTIERNTHHSDPRDAARFEVTGLKWSDLSEAGEYGVSLLNDCKYGHDTKDNVLRLSLLRAPGDPDPKADEGEHEFTYSLYPHQGDWRTGTVEEGFELNNPLVGEVVPASKGALPPVYCFASVDAEHVVVDTIKKAEDSKALIVRLYEAYGSRGDVNLTFAQTPKRITECDCMEENDEVLKAKGNTVKSYIKPYEIRTFKVTF
jgi:alpha-mannosidase